MTLKETFDGIDSDTEAVTADDLPINGNAILVLPHSEGPVRIGQLSRETGEIIAFDPNDPSNL